MKIIVTEVVIIFWNYLIFNQPPIFSTIYLCFYVFLSLVIFMHLMN